MAKRPHKSERRCPLVAGKQATEHDAPAESTIRRSRSRRRVACVAVFVLIFAAAAGLYHQTLHHGVVLDDRSYVMENPYLEDAACFLYPLNFSAFANSAAKMGRQSDFALNFITRPVTYATFFWNRLAGGTETAGYRLVNIGIHAINGILVFALGLLLARGGDWRTGTDEEEGRMIIPPALAALLFTVHPLMTESVTYITQRFESLATMFGLLAILVWFKSGTGEGGRPSGILRGASVLLTLAAMLSKETGFVIPLLIILADSLCFGRPFGRAIRRAFPLLVCMPLIPVMVMAVAFVQQGQQINLWQALNITNIGETMFSPVDYALTQVGVAVSYLRMLLLPVGQNFDADYPLVTSIFDLRFAISSMVVGGLFTLGWLLRRRWSDPHGNALLFGLAWYLVALAPSSSFVPLPDLYAEHRSYLPSVGVFLALSGLLSRLASARPGLPWRIGVRGVIAVWIGLLSIATIQRNKLMRSDETIYEDVVAKSPGKWRAWNGLGTAYGRQRRLDEAVDCFRRAASIKPTGFMAYVNLGTVLLMLRQPGQALEVCDEGLREFPANAKLHHNRGMALCALGRTREAVREFRIVLQRAPEFRESHLCLGKIFYELGPHQLALLHYRHARASGPLHALDETIYQKLVAEHADSGPVLAGTGGR